MQGHNLRESAETPNYNWLVTPLPSALSSKSAMVRVQLDRLSKR
jgi:hypothetical protein